VDIFEFQIIDGSNQVEPKPDAFATILIALTEIAKGFQPANYVLDQKPLLRYGSVVEFLFLAQWM
jgi:hypothetical protein